MERARGVDAPCPSVAEGIIDHGREGLLLVGEDQGAGTRVVVVRELRVGEPRAAAGQDQELRAAGQDHELRAAGQDRLLNCLLNCLLN